MLHTPYTYYQTPSAGLPLEQITGDRTLIREFVARSRIEYKANEQCANDKPLTPHPFYRMTLTCTSGKTPVSLKNILAEIKQRAENGSRAAQLFLNALDKFQRTNGGVAFKTVKASDDISEIVHAFIKTETLPAGMRTYFDDHSPRNLEVDAPRKKPDPTSARNWIAILAK